MSKQSMKMPEIEHSTCTRFVCAVFCTSALTSFVMVMLRLLRPELFYEDELEGTDLIIHLVVCGTMLVTSMIGFINSAVVMVRSPSEITVKYISFWLLMDSLFESSRVIYMFICEVVIGGGAIMQTYDLFISCGQYSLDLFICYQMVVRY